VLRSTDRVRRVGGAAPIVPDDALLAGVAAGDERLTVAFVRRFQRQVYGIALAVTGDPALAEDVAQQAFERAWRRADAYDPCRGAVATWLAAITRNLAIDAVRVARPHPVDPERLLRSVTAPDDTERSAVAAEGAEELRAALRTLPAEQARAVVLAGIAGLTAPQVAAVEGIPLGTAKTRIRTAMHRLRSTLDHGGPHG
jgi:RNA polymerase sigma factor (sigma-70 family)